MKKFILTSILSLSTVFVLTAQTVPSTCVDIQNNLSYRNRVSQLEDQILKSEVITLQNFLANTRSPITKRPYISQTAFLKVTPGDFDEVTAAAVRYFQFEKRLVKSRAVKSSAVILGSVTRAKIAEASGCTIMTAPISAPVSKIAEPKMAKLTLAPGATAVVTDNPTLALEYDSSNSEASLVARATVSVTAGYSDLYLYNVNAANALAFINSNGVNPGMSNTEASGTLIDGNATLVMGVNGLSFYKIPANETATFAFVAKRNPKLMFAGAYTVSVQQMDAYTSTNALQEEYVSVPVAPNTSRQVTIVGEVSPYISSAAVDATGLVRLTGARFDLPGNLYMINGVTSITNSKGDANNISFNANEYNLSAGYHTVQILNPRTGNSNTISFEVATSFTGTASAYIMSSPSPTLTLKYNSQNKEASLVYEAYVNVTATGGDIKINSGNDYSKDGYTFNIINTNSLNQPAVSSSSPVATFAAGLTKGNGLIVPSGNRATYKVTQVYNVKQSFPGSYKAAIQLYDPTYTRNLLGGNTTNAVTIIGETSPYITTAVIDGNNNVVLTGVRFHPTGNTIISGDQRLNLPSTDGGTKIVFSLRSLGITNTNGYFNVQVSHPTEGLSNSYYVQFDQPNSITIFSPTAGLIMSPGDPLAISWQSVGSSNANYAITLKYNSITSGSNLIDRVIGTYSAAKANCDAADKCYIYWTPFPGASNSVSVVIRDTVSGKFGVSGIFNIPSTSGSVPVTNPARGITATGAILDMFFNGLSNSYTTNFNWGTNSSSLTNEVRAVKNDSIQPLEAGYMYSAPILGLYPNTQYYYKANAKNNTTGESLSGNVLSFMTLGGATAPAPTLTFTGNNSVGTTTVTSGQPVYLRWSSTNALLCNAGGSWSGMKATSSVEVVYPQQTTTYTLSCGGVAGEANQITRSITVLIANTTCPNGQTWNGTQCAGTEIPIGTTPNASAYFVSTPTLTMQKDSFGKDSLLKAEYVVNVYAPTSNVTVTGALGTAGMYVFRGRITNTATQAITSNIATTTVKWGAGVTTGSVDNNTITIPVGNRATVIVTMYFDAKTLPAGNYIGNVFLSPIVGNSITPSTPTNQVTVAGVTPTTPTVSMSSGGGSLTLGSESKLAEFIVSASPNGDIGIKSFVVAVGVSALTNPTITNFRLTDSGNQTIALASVVGNGLNAYVTFTTPYQIQRGSSKTFVLYGVVNGTRSTEIEYFTTASLPPAYFIWNDSSTNSTYTADKISSFPFNLYRVTGRFTSLVSPAPTVNFSASNGAGSVNSPTPLEVTSAQRVTLTWSSTGMSSCTPSGTDANNPINAGYWTGTAVNTSGTKTFTSPWFSTAVTNPAPVTYTISCTPLLGGASITKSIEVKKAVTAPVAVEKPIAMCDYSVAQTGCTWVAGPNYTASNQCGKVLQCAEVVPVRKLNTAQFISQNVPGTMIAGQTYSVSVTMKNTGNTTWTQATYKLGSQNPQDNTTWGGRTYLATGESIAPGAQKTFTFNVRAPANVSSSNFQWRMVEEGVEWFGDSTSNITVTVTQPAPTQQLVSYTPTSSSGPAIGVLSPRGGETYKVGSTITMKWKFENVNEGNNSTVLQIHDNSAPYKSIYTGYASNPTVNGDISVEGTQTFTIPSGTTPGSYALYISNADGWSETGYFNIVP